MMDSKFNKRNFFTFYFLLFTLFASAQQTGIHYGSNPKAGKYYAVRGIKMYCEIYGQGKPLLLIHGNGGDMSAFSKTIPYFSKHYKVIAVDSRAQGKTMDNKDSLSFEMMADDFAELLTQLHIDSAYIIGWSDGGINALVMAMRHPGKVKKLAATGANLWPDSTALLPSLWKEMHDYYEASKSKKWTTAKEINDWKIFLLDWLQPNIALAQLKNINCPSLIIAGDDDLIVTEHTVAIARYIPHANLWILPNSSHSTLIEYADEFNKKVDAFFRR